MSDALEAEITGLPKLKLAQLQARWRRALKQAPPPHVPKPLLVPLLAYKLQEQAYGGLKPDVKRRLRELTVSFNREPSNAPERLWDPLRIKPGTRLIREWKEKTHSVTVGDHSLAIGRT